MRMLHSDAIENKEYSIPCHTESFEMLNHGELTFIDPTRIRFASMLMSPCRQEMT